MNTIITAILFFLVANSQCLFAQTDTIPPTKQTKENLYEFFIIDNLRLDKTSAYKREMDGAVNFMQISEGYISSTARNSKVNFDFFGSIDSIANVNENATEILRVYISRNYTGTSATKPFILDISTETDNSISLHIYPKKALGEYFINAHNASAAETEKVVNYFKENQPEY